MFTPNTRKYYHSQVTSAIVEHRVMPQLGQKPRILITRLSAIGDCIHTLPLLKALRSHFPAAHIVWATQSAFASLIDGHQALDAVVTIDRRWWKNWRSIQTTTRVLRSHRFDVAIDPQSLTKSSLLGWISGAKHRIGFARGQGRELSPLLSTIRVVPQNMHVVDRYLELLRPVGIGSPQVEFELPLPRETPSSVDGFLVETGMVDKDFALLNPGAGWNSKRWPHRRYAEVARHLFRKRSIPSMVLWSGDQERSWAEDIVAAADQAAVLAPNTSLSELADLCARAVIFVGSDTGPMHLAAAMSTPCVALYGPTRISECGPYGIGHQSLQAYYQSGSSKQRRGDDNSAMRAITVDSVCAACDRIITVRNLRVA